MDNPSRHNPLDYEILMEQAGALGIAGRQLKAALDEHQKHVMQGGRDGEPRTEELLDEVASRIYALVLQREFVGFAQNNIEWLQHAFALPAGVLSRLGSLPGQRSARDPK
jgi:hypothetical protein